mmetsp:Transcript_20682/g.50804  ORF Transcript_20682/g.50804 Transcript_20682/m.50804 type:complete len:88 (+) Transcript_20682:1158-1421(+)
MNWLVRRSLTGFVISERKFLEVKVTKRVQVSSESLIGYSERQKLRIRPSKYVASRCVVGSQTCTVTPHCNQKESCLALQDTNLPLTY